MTKIDFENRLNALYDQHPIIKISKVKTFNELTYVLRMDQSSVDYNIATVDPDGSYGFIVSVKECFIPTRDLAKHVKKIEFDEYDREMDTICLTVHLVD